MPEPTMTLSEFTSAFDQYCEDSQIVEDRKWTRKESERLRDFHIYMESLYITMEEA